LMESMGGEDRAPQIPQYIERIHKKLDERKAGRTQPT
jgi:hypothetical protein